MRSFFAVSRAERKAHGRRAGDAWRVTRPRPSFKVHMRHIDAHLPRELDERGHKEHKRGREH